ncbi:MAG: 4a-hydroxytetrahydrobiopterin dehydratase [Kofleriaceae bacterium]
MSNRELDDLATHTISRDAIAPDELARELVALGPRWSVVGGELQLVLEAPMGRTGAVAAFAGSIADELDHHPRMVLDHRGLVLTIHTHDAKAITVLDLVFAARLEQYLRANGWPA